MAVEPLAGKRLVRVSERKTKDWAKIPERNCKRIMSMLKKITLVMDNLNTHTPGSLYETFIPAQAKEILERFEFVYIRQSMEVGLIWREIELNVLIEAMSLASNWEHRADA